MFIEIINKLKKKKQELQNLNNIPIEEKTTFDITNAKENKIYKMKFSDYHYFSAKHDKIGSTFYTKYYNRFFVSVTQEVYIMQVSMRYS